MIDFNREKVGKRIKELRLECGLSQSKLGKLVGVAQNTIAQYENNSVVPKTEVVFKLSIVLKSSSDYILGLSDF